MAASVEEYLDDNENLSSYTDLCKICLRNRSRYICPRCNTPYCSLNCYKSNVHLDCSESFYEEWVENDLKANRITPDGQKKMLEILKRAQVEDNDLDSDDDASIPDIAERLSGVDLDDTNAIWENLSPDEQAAFKELVTTGKVSDIIPPWEPWWTKRFDEPRIMEIDDNISSSYENYKNNCPAVCRNIKPLADICKSKPSPLIIFDLINILGGYALTARYYNGEYFDMFEEARTLIFNVSQSMGTAQNFTSSEMALEAVGLQALICQGIETGEQEIKVMKNDVKCIFSGPSDKDRTYYILSALTDMYSLFSAKRKNSTNKGKFFQTFPSLENGDIKLIDRETCRKCLRRIAFMQSWTKDCDVSALNL